MFKLSAWLRTRSSIKDASTATNEHTKSTQRRCLEPLYDQSFSTLPLFFSVNHLSSPALCIPWTSNLNPTEGTMQRKILTTAAADGANHKPWMQPQRKHFNSIFTSVRFPSMFHFVLVFKTKTHLLCTSVQASMPQYLIWAFVLE